jgi:hypothetical protein
VGVEDLGRQFIEIEELLLRGRRAPHHRIDQAACAALAQLHRLENRRMIRQLQDQQLAQPYPQDVAGFIVQLALAEFGDPVIQQAEIPQHPEDDRIEEGAVGGGKAVPRSVALDQVFGIGVPFAPGAEDGDGSTAG